MLEATSQSSPLVLRILTLLMPYFADTGFAKADVYEAILQTIEDYHPNNRAQLIQAAQCIALSLSSLDALHEAAALDLTPAMRVRLRANANALNRSAERTAKDLENRQEAQAPQPPAAKPKTQPRAPEPQTPPAWPQAQRFVAPEPRPVPA